MILTIWRSPRKFWLILLSTISLISISYSVVAQEVANLPPAPSTGTPDDSFSAGGTRSEPNSNQTCDSTNPSLVYLLDSGIRDFTVSAHPIFWFYSPYTVGQIGYLEFTLADVQTTKTIYRSKIDLREQSGIMGIALPQEQKYALEPNKDYSWNLQIYCSPTEDQPDIFFEGWLRRLPITYNLKQDLAAFPAQHYSVYLENNILYDALTNLAQLRQTKPNNSEIMEAWNHLLTDLGKKDLIQQPILEAVIYSAQDE